MNTKIIKQVEKDFLKKYDYGFFELVEKEERGKISVREKKMLRTAQTMISFAEEKEKAKQAEAEKKRKDRNRYLVLMGLMYDNKIAKNPSEKQNILSFAHTYFTNQNDREFIINYLQTEV